MPEWTLKDTSQFSDEDYQAYSLQGVSRTFALTIPQLPEKLRLPVGNAYLLCRITDTIEDVATLSIDKKEQFAREFVAVVKGERDGDTFAVAFAKELSNASTEAERDLILNTARAVRLTHSFSPVQRRAIERCVEEMAGGMLKFQKRQSLDGLRDVEEMSEYCYYVAGVVGVMLTELFCDYSPQMEQQRSRMLELAVSFGQGLQMTNILKDIWEDRKRGACWLPRESFSQCAFDLKDIAEHKNDACYLQNLEALVALAVEHLHNALEYTMMIPLKERGVRRFCLWAIGMALLTLRNIQAKKNFSSGQEVKISRRSVKLTVFVTELVVGSNNRSAWMFRQLAKRLP